MADILNGCLEMLDLLGLPQAAAHLCAAIEAMPGQSARPPVELENMSDHLAEGTAGPGLRVQVSAADGPPKQPSQQS